MVNANSSPEDLIAAAKNALSATADRDKKHALAYAGERVLEQIGLAVPPELSRFEVVINWPRLVVDTIADRQEVKGLYLPGSDQGDETLDALWGGNDLDSDLPLLLRGLLVYGRGYLSVGSADEPDGLPLIHVEDPTQLAVFRSRRTRRVEAAVRLYRDLDQSPGDLEDTTPTHAVIYRPGSTQWLVHDRGRWYLDGPADDHNLGVVPVIPFYNRRQIQKSGGQSELVDILDICDAASRAFTVLQIAVEALALPKIYLFGIANDAFKRANGQMMSRWESYMNTIQANPNDKASVHQINGANLSNFHDTVREYALHAAALTGFPAHYFGVTSTNPAAEGAIRAAEAQMVKKIETKNAETGSQLGRALALAYRLQTGQSVDGARVRVSWHDPGTPTVAQRADAVRKLAGDIELLTREGAWEELGWSEPRKTAEAARFEAQDRDPVLAALDAKAGQ